MLHTHGHGNSIRCFEANAHHILSKAIGIFLETCNGSIAVNCLELGCITTGNAIGFQKQHKLPKAGQGLIGLANSYSLFGADALDLGQALRV